MKGIKERVLAKLSGNEIKLGLAQDFESLFKISESNSNKAFDTLDRLSKDSEKTLSEAISTANKAIKMAEQLEAKSKDLGLPLPKEVNDRKRTLEDDVKNLLALRKRVSGISLM